MEPFITLAVFLLILYAFAKGLILFVRLIKYIFLGRRKAVISPTSRISEVTKLYPGKGFIYVISNKRSFNNNSVKIGMTSRYSADFRIKELSSASVPFPFDEEEVFFVTEAKSMESKIHKALSNRRVNKENVKKEFFHASVAEIQDIIYKNDRLAIKKSMTTPEEWMMIYDKF